MLKITRYSLSILVMFIFFSSMLYTNNANAKSCIGTVNNVIKHINNNNGNVSRVFLFNTIVNKNYNGGGCTYKPLNSTRIIMKNLKTQRYYACKSLKGYQKDCDYNIQIEYGGENIETILLNRTSGDGYYRYHGEKEEYTLPVTFITIERPDGRKMRYFRSVDGSYVNPDGKGRFTEIPLLEK